MKVLPAVTTPPSERLVRRHVPKASKNYRNYRSCLRWDFGFSCAFCLLHEADVSDGHGAEGTGLMWIEHLVAQSADSTLVAEYTNCFYSCRYCNRARSASAHEGESGNLLDPTRCSWGNRFSWAGDSKIIWADDDVDACYTGDTYDLNDPRKVSLRKQRAKTLLESLEILEKLPTISRVLEIASRVSEEDRADLLEAVAIMQRECSNARTTLLRYVGVPRDANDQCRCGNNSEHALPAYLESQLVDV